MNVEIRKAEKKDVDFIAKCIMVGSDMATFQEGIDESSEYFKWSVKICGREDTKYSYVYTDILYVDGNYAGACVSTPGKDYLELRKNTFTGVPGREQYADYSYPVEVLPDEYYLDTASILPEYRGHHLIYHLMDAAMQKGKAAGYQKAALLVTSYKTELVKHYEKKGFVLDGEAKEMFGSSFVRMVRRID